MIPSNQVQTREATCVILGSLLQLFNFYFVIYSGNDCSCAMLGTLSHPETGIPEILSLQRYTQHSHALNFLMLRFLTGISLWHLYYYFNFSSYLNKLLPNSEVAWHQWFPAVCQTFPKAECSTAMEILRWSIVDTIMTKKVTFASYNFISRKRNS